ncbi:MAG: hypothetical protein WCL51_14110 [Bacteroidota bacterium]
MNNKVDCVYNICCRIDNYKSLYKISFGVSKFEKVNSHISDSKKINKLIFIAEEKNIIPNSADYINALNEIPYFIFSKGDTQALGAILSFEKWIMYNIVPLSDNESGLPMYEKLNQIFDGILNNCSRLGLTIRA